MATFTPLESTKDLQKDVLLRGRGHQRQTPQPVGVVIDRTCRVYISQIPVENIEREGPNALRREFEAYGPIESYKMFTEKSGRFVGSALCTYRNPADAGLAIEGMNGRVIGSSMLQVSLSNEHGIMLLHPSHNRGFISRNAQDNTAHKESDGSEGEGAKKEDDKWHHDKYQLISEGKDMDEVLGIRRYRRGGGRGRGFDDRRRGPYLSHGERIDREFENYISERDRQLRGGQEKPFEEDLVPAKNDPQPVSNEGGNGATPQPKPLGEEGEKE